MELRLIRHGLVDSTNERALAAIADGLGYSDLRQLNRDDLVALTPEAVAITGLPFEPGYRDRDIPERKAG